MYTNAGNVRAPSKALCLQWVRESWEALSSELIAKSFRACGISVNIDGSEDGDVHCLKDGGVAEDARVAIDRDTGTLLSGEDRDYSDPFEEEEDEDQLEEIDDC